MGDEHKTKEQLISELMGMRQRITQLEASKAEHQRQEEELRESRKTYKNTLDRMLEGCQIIDFDWCYLYVNDAVARHGHRSREELLGHTMMEMYPGIEDTEMFAALRRCMEKRTPHHM